MAVSEADRISWEATGVARLRGQATEGLWPGEYSVQLDIAGTFVGLTVRESEVNLTGQRGPVGVQDVELRVRVVGHSEKFKDWVVVRLPRETSNSGPIIEVPSNLLLGELKDALVA